MRNCFFEDNDFTTTVRPMSLIKKDNDEKPNLNKEDNFSCEFNNCNIYSKFMNCPLEYIIFNKCNDISFYIDF